MLRLATLVGVEKGGSRHAGLGEDVADVDALRGDAVVECRRRAGGPEPHRGHRADRDSTDPYRKQFRSSVDGTWAPQYSSTHSELS